MEEIRRLEERKQKLLNAIEFVEQKKKYIIEIVQTLVSQYNSGRISRIEYDQKLKQALGNRPAEQWLEYYEDYVEYYNYQIELCEKLIKEEKSKSMKKKSGLILKIFIILILVGIVISLVFVFRTEILDLTQGIGEKISSLDFGVDEEAKILKQNMVLIQIPSKNLEFFEPTIQGQAVLGESVEWKTEINIGEILDFNLELPGDSENVIVKKIDDQGFKEEIEFTRKGKFLGIGRGKVNIGGVAKKYEIEYETSSPEIEVLEESEEIKKVKISCSDEIHYENILTFTDIPEIFSVDEKTKIRIYEVKEVNGEEIREEIKFNVYDTNENDLLDFVEWITPELSEAVFEIIFGGEAPAIEGPVALGAPICSGPISFQLLSNLVCVGTQNGISSCDSASDGDSGTRWRVWYSSFPNPEIYGDLGEKKCLSNVRIEVGPPPLGWEEDWIDVQVSDDAVEWNTVVSDWYVFDVGVWHEPPDFPAGTEGRYVKLIFTSCNSGLCNLREFEVNSQSICTPLECSTAPQECGIGWDDGCGSTFDCPDCPGGQYCDGSGTCQLATCPGSMAGSGISGDPCQVTTCVQLQAIDDPVALGLYYRLENNIDCSATNPAVGGSIWGAEGFDPIGGLSPDSFGGTFDGQNHKITNLYINRPTENFVGLFGAVNYAEIRDVQLVDVEIRGNMNVGGLFGFVSWFSEIYLCSVISITGIVEGEENVGGLIGYFNSGSVEGCSADVDVDSNGRGGGLIGYQEFGSVYNSFAKGDVFGATYAGGLIGINNGDPVYNSYATGNVEGNIAGGLIGYNKGSVSGVSVIGTYATGDVFGATYAGGLIGHTYWTGTAHSYATGDVSGSGYIGGLIGVIEEQYADIYNCFYFGDEVECVGWDSPQPQYVECTKETDVTNFYDVTAPDAHAVYTGTTPWDFTTIWDDVWDNQYYPPLRWENQDPFGCPGNPTMAGDGTSGNPCQVTSCENLQDINQGLTLYYRLEYDIDCYDTYPDVAPGGYWGDGKGFNPIGDSSNPFTGNFDGQYFTITKFYIGRDDLPTGGETDVGLFGYVSAGGEIKNIGLKDIEVMALDNVGGLVGVNEGTIIDSYTTGSVNGPFSYAYEYHSENLGGLIGYNKGSVLRSFSKADVIGDDYSGACPCPQTAAIFMGGLVGLNEGTISDSYATGDVVEYLSGNGLGGLVGNNNLGTVTNSYAIGTVLTDSAQVLGGIGVGGLVNGDSNDIGGIVTNSYYDNINHQSYYTNSIGAESTADLQDVDWLSGNTWEFTTVWDNIWDTHYYPPLRWENANEIDECVTLEIPGVVYILSENIQNNTLAVGMACIDIQAEGITLDCNDFTIRSTSTDAIGVFSNSPNTIIKNCDISIGGGSAAYGIKLNSGADNSQVLDSVLNGQTLGLYSNGPDNLIIERVTTNNNQNGIHLRGPGGGHVLRGVTSLNNAGYGMYLRSGSSGNNFYDCILLPNGAGAVYSREASANNNFINCTDYESGAEVFKVDENGELFRKWYYRGYVRYEGDATEVIDSKGGNDGVRNNGAHLANDNLVLDGSDDYVEVASDSSLNIVDFMTISLWVKQENGDNAYIIVKGTEGSDEKYYGLYSRGSIDKINFPYTTGGVSQIPGWVLTDDIDDGGWHHLLIVVDYPKLRLHVDGKLISEKEMVGPMDSADSPVFIGRRNWADLFFNGEIGDIKIWNSALNDAEVQKEYSYGAHVKNADLVSHWTFENIAVDANVDALDSINGKDFSLITDSSGYTDVVGITEYKHLNDFTGGGGAIIDYSDYFIEASKGDGYDSHDYVVEDKGYGWKNDLKDVFTLQFPDTREIMIEIIEPDNLYVLQEKVQNVLFDVVVKVTCLVGDCGSVEVFLDPPPDDCYGDSNLDGVYEVCSCYDLDRIRSEDLSRNYALQNDIDFDDCPVYKLGMGWDPIGDTANKFTGSFNGRRHLIKNLYINRPIEDYIGLFGRTEYASISNVGLVDVNIVGNKNVGGLVGDAYIAGFVDNCYVTGTIEYTGTGYYTQVGGLVGRSTAVIRNSYAKVDITSSSLGERIGGLVGYNRYKIFNSYATGSVTGSGDVGGLVGFNSVDMAGDQGYIENSYATGDATGTVDIGGLVGSNDGGMGLGTIIKGYYNNHPGNPGVCIGAGSSGADCTAIDNNEPYFYTIINPPMDDWDFSYVWSAENNGIDYPVLNSEPLLDCFDASVDPIPICTCDDLDKVRLDLTANYVLRNNIDFDDCHPDYTTGEGWEPITIFSGTFYGNGKVISNLYINRISNNLGLFGLTNNAEIRYLGLENVDITGNNQIGGLVGSGSGIIEKCYVEGGDVRGYNWGSGIGNYVGGLAGIFTGEISESYTDVSVKGFQYQVGGLVGSSTGTIRDCYAKGSVTVDQWGYTFGGLVGRGSEVINSYATGVVSGGSNGAGGLIGGIGGTKAYDIKNSYAIGTVSGIPTAYNIGGLIGAIGGAGANLENDYWYDNPGDDADYCVGSEPGGGRDCNKINPSPPSVFYDKTHVVYTTGDEPWDFNGVWYELSDDYPIFIWQVDKGLIPPCTDNPDNEPFCHDGDPSNPHRTVSLSEGESETIIFDIKPIGEVGTIRKFFAYANLTDNMEISDMSDNWFVEIIEPTSAEIVWISDIVGEDEIPDNPVLDEDRDLLEGGVVTKKEFRFYVYTPEGASLPGPGGDAITTDNVYVTLVYTGTLDQPGDPDWRKSFKCEHVEDDPAYDYTTDDCSPLGLDCVFDDTDPGLPPGPTIPVRKYNCSVEVQYYDNFDEDWDIRAYVESSAGGKEGYEQLLGQPTGTLYANDVDQPSRQTYWNWLTDFMITNPVSDALDFGEVAYDDNLNREPENGHLELTNTGNDEIAQVKLIAFDIPKIDDLSKMVFSEGFYTHVSDPCNDLAVPLRIQLIDDTQFDTGMDVILYGPLGDLGVSSNLLICLDEIPYRDSTPSGGYSTTVGTKWVINTVYLLAAISIGRNVRNRRKRKKKKELTEENLLEVIEEKLKQKYGIDLDDLLSDKEEVKKEVDEGIKVPICIFKQKIGAAEVLSGYLKENKNLRFSEIAKLINRDQRTVGLNYKNAIKKKMKIKIEKNCIFVPAEIFSDRRLSILESLVYYFKKKGFRNSEIAGMINKDQRNIWTLYSRAEKKLKKLNK